MKANPAFSNQSKSYWANIRAISETVGYTERRKGVIKVPDVEDIKHAMLARKLEYNHLIKRDQTFTKFGQRIYDYFEYRSRILNKYVRSRLMDAEQAKREFVKLRKTLKPKCPLPMNKQKGDKKAPAYLTGMVNMIIESKVKGFDCDYDPRSLTTITRGGKPLRTFARRLDGAFPSNVNPLAVWEIKEYYHTTTFVSRVADGVYETLLDGMELAELREREKIDILHYLVIDAYYTWWDCGKSYLCRIIDSLHMGYIHEVLFGSEVIERLPEIVDEWLELI